MKITPKEFCDGCSVLASDKSFHCHLQTKFDKKTDVLFITDSYKADGLVIDSLVEDLLIRAVRKLKPKEEIFWGVIPSVQCPNVKEDDMTPSDREKCRNYLTELVETIKPKLIITLGNMAFKMLTKKSGISEKRGSRFDITILHNYIVVPTLHPFSVIAEPKYRYYFELDIRNAIEKYVLNKTEHQAFIHRLIMSAEELNKYSFLKTADFPIAIDIETTGLNFKKNYITTVGFSWDSGTIVIPWQHKEGKFEDSEFQIAKQFVKEVLENKNNKKVLQNAKFDMKFLKKEGIEIVNPWDTMVMAHLIYEDRRKGLLDLVKEYFPRELENL